VIAVLKPHFRCLPVALAALLCRTQKVGLISRGLHNLACVDKFRTAAIWHFNCLEMTWPMVAGYICADQ
jgi:hypothetical protein